MAAQELDIMETLRPTLKPSFHYPSWRPKLTGDRFPLPVNTGCVNGHAFPLAELTGRVLVETRARQHGPTGNGNWSPVNSGSGNRALLTAASNIQSTLLYSVYTARNT